MSKFRPRPRAARSQARATNASESSKVPSPTLSPVLVVEDSQFSARLIEVGIRRSLHCPVVVAQSKAEATQALQNARVPFFAAVAGLQLPDAPNGAVIDLLLEQKVPTVVLTASYNERSRQQILARGVVDYHVKGAQSLEFVLLSLRRLVENPETKILIVDDSASCRAHLKRLLGVQRFQVLEASDGSEGVNILNANPDVSLVIVDFEMPGISGVEFVSTVRRQRGPDSLVILGASAAGARELPAKFLKHGADDFICKPFLKEELYCRVHRSLDALARLEEIRRLANTDQLTQLNNRLSFFQRVPSIYDERRLSGDSFWTAMVDIDHFKRINDTYGHAGGDAALRNLATTMKSALPEDCFIARFGGEEFCIVSGGTSSGNAFRELENLRKIVERSPILFEDTEFGLTVSIGFTTDNSVTLDEAINSADQALYRAKTAGRNRVVDFSRLEVEDLSASLASG